MNVRTVYLGLGTNLSDRHAWLDQGLAALEEALVARKSIQSMSMSPRYETEAWGMAEGTPAFLNMVVGVDTAMSLDALLHVLLDIEREHGRVRDPGAEGYLNRTLDMDILCTAEGEIWSADDLAVPHPRMMSRRFVLQPLADLNPTLRVAGQTIREALNSCPSTPEVVPVATPS
jgi:2-amino-4-hydroxy-6-hydroxymethyldihydropteridine diphosphokinase